MPQDFVLRTHYGLTAASDYRIVLDTTVEVAERVARSISVGTTTVHPALSVAVPDRAVGDELTGAELDELPTGSAVVCIELGADLRGVGALVRHAVGWLGSDERVERLARPAPVAPEARFRILHIGSGQ